VKTLTMLEKGRPADNPQTLPLMPRSSVIPSPVCVKMTDRISEKPEVAAFSNQVSFELP
jgi:hypothetical protein